MENIRRKLQVRSRAQIATWVTEHRLGPLSGSGSSPAARTGDRPDQGRRRIRRSFTR